MALTFSSKVVVISQAVTVVNEGILTAACYPGHLLCQDATTPPQYKLQDVASIKTEMNVALENDLYGKGIATQIATGALVRMAVLRSGDRANMRLTNGLTGIVAGTKLESNGDGTLKVYSAGVPLAVALQAQTNATSVANDLQAVEIL